jgi:hypothetical protein
VVGFGLLLFASCSVGAVALGLNRLNLADLRAGAVGWTPAPYTPGVTPLPVDESQPAGSPRFTAGQKVLNVTNSRVNLRRSPGYLSKPEGDVVGVLQPAAAAVVLGENQLADSLTWWQVRATLDNGQEVEGWVAEATASGVQILGAE